MQYTILHIDNMPGHTFCALNCIFFKSDNAIPIENNLGRTFWTPNRIFFKSDDAKHIGNKPGRIFRALNKISFKCGSIFSFYRRKKVMALDSVFFMLISEVARLVHVQVISHSLTARAFYGFINCESYCWFIEHDLLKLMN